MSRRASGHFRDTAVWQWSVRLANAGRDMARQSRAAGPGLQKAPSGIRGLDEITHGGLPKGRPTLVCGGPGCGKSLMGVEFLIRGAMQFVEPGVLMTFEETEEDIKKNVASLGFDLEQLVRDKKIVVDHVK